MASQFAHKQPTRFNAPEIDQDLATKGYVDNTVTTGVAIFGQQSHDSITNNEVNTWFGSLNAAGSGERRFIAAVAGTLSLLCFDLQTNSNTVDGANFKQVLDDVDGNEIVTVDQATGFFQDITNSDTYLLGVTLYWQYEQGNSSVVMFSACCQMVPT